MSYQKGYRRELELITELEKEGFATMRSPASGKGGKSPDGTEREQPDIIAGNGESFYGIESKASAREMHIYIPIEEVDDLIYFCKKFGLKPRIGARFDYNDFAFFKPEELYQTEKSYRITLEDIESAAKISDLK